MNKQRSYHFKPNPNFPTHYTPVLRNHENFSYGEGAQQRENRGDYQGQKRTQSFEDQMLHFMSKNKRILNLHENFLF